MSIVRIGDETWSQHMGPSYQGLVVPGKNQDNLKIANQMANCLDLIHLFAAMNEDQSHLQSVAGFAEPFFHGADRQAPDHPVGHQLPLQSLDDGIVFSRIKQYHCIFLLSRRRVQRLKPAKAITMPKTPLFYLYFDFRRLSH